MSYLLEQQDIALWEEINEMCKNIKPDPCELFMENEDIPNVELQFE
jgi:hypothetical protein